MAEKREPNFKVVADNRRARFDYEIGETFEAGLALTGTEVKSLRTGKATIAESYAHVDRKGEAWLVNANIPEYLQATASTTSPSGRANCCCKQRELAKLAKGDRARGHDHRAAAALFQRQGPRQDRRSRSGAARNCTTSAKSRRKRDWNREKGRLLREKG